MCLGIPGQITQEALIAMSQLEHEVGDFLGLNQK